jgi:hypothetical protein
VVGVHGKITKKSGGNPGEPVTAGWSNNQALHQKWTAGYMFIHFGFHWVVQATIMGICHALIPRPRATEGWKVVDRNPTLKTNLRFICRG